MDSPNLPVKTSFQEFTELELGRFRITSVGIDLLDDPGSLIVVKELPQLSLGIGEVNQKPVAGDCNQACEYSFDDKDPYNGLQVSKLQS
jgi:hypothetical protein